MSKDGFQRAEIEEIARKLVGATHPDGVPNLNDLYMAIRDFGPMRLNMKFFGYRLARELAAALPEPETVELSHVGLKCKPSTQIDIESDWVAYWTRQLQIRRMYHRKIWELCYAMQAFHEAGVLREGARGLGFGCGEEPLPSLLASYGCDVVVTDLHPEDQNVAGWSTTAQHTHSLDAAFAPHLVDRPAFDKHVSLEYVDMNAIPDHLRDFDFCWSICALEHVGSIAKGLDFIENSIDTLKPGGVAVHTTEFNFSREDTVDNWPTVLFQRKHFQEISDRLTAKGYSVAPLDFDVGNMPMDQFIDVPPYIYDVDPSWRSLFNDDCGSMKLSVDGFPSTCFGLIIRK